MLKKLIITSIVLGASAPAWSVPEPQSLVLQPTMTQRYASREVTRFLTNMHYRDIRLDDSLSSQMLDHYIETLDPNRSYFLEGDVQMFERFRFEMDDALRFTQLSPAFEIYNLYSERVRQRSEYARSRLEAPFDFTVDEEFQFDRSEAAWATTQEELDDIWRKRIKNDYLRLMLAGKEHDAIIETLDDRYENIERRIAELDSEDVFQFFMNSFAMSIEPHTAYLSPRTSENFEISMKLSLEGIGALLGRESEFTEIARVVPGGPASLDGRLQAGDRIMSVGQGRDGKMVDVIGWRVDDVVELIRGPKETVVRLEVLPEESGLDGPSHVIDLVRDEVKLEEQAAKSRIIEMPDESGRVRKVGVIDLPVFYLDFNGRAMNRPDYRSSSRDVKRLIDEMKAEGVESLVMDLRNNGGGSLLEATTLTGLFIDQGPVVQVRNSNGRVSIEEDRDPGMAWDGPLVVLVNRYSASASEIFAAAIQDYGRGLVVGEPTFGKGTVQSLIEIDDYVQPEREGMGQLKMTIAQFFRVNGGSTQNRGVVPDIRFPSAGEPQEYGERSLDNALPYSEIDPARYENADDLSMLVAVADQRHRARRDVDPEFGWLQSDIEEYNETVDQVSISLLESARRQEMEEQEARRKERKAQREAAGLPTNDDLLLASEETDGEEAEADAEADSEADQEEAPDLLLREAARVASDMATLNDGDGDLLAREFSMLETRRDSPLN